MRPIQYKMFDKITQKIETVSILNIESNIAKYEIVATGQTISRTIGVECELMQYTWCKDKNEEMIYEGDIIWEGYIYDNWDYKYWIREVKWEQDWFNLSQWWDDWSWDIIWNIYQSPELLK